jgi:hypothetical protein
MTSTSASSSSNSSSRAAEGPRWYLPLQWGPTQRRSSWRTSCDSQFPFWTMGWSLTLISPLSYPANHASNSLSILILYNLEIIFMVQIKTNSQWFSDSIVDFTLSRPLNGGSIPSISDNTISTQEFSTPAIAAASPFCKPRLKFQQHRRQPQRSYHAASPWSCRCNTASQANTVVRLRIRHLLLLRHQSQQVSVGFGLSLDTICWDFYFT